MIVAEVLDASHSGLRAGADPERNPVGAAEVQRLCALVADAIGIHGGHVAVQFASADQIARLNLRYRGLDEPTDVLSFPIDGTDEVGEEATRELGDIVICPAYTDDVSEAIVHAMLHLLGMDHETDDGEMLALQRELMLRATDGATP